jgi:hypothetical protein
MKDECYIKYETLDDKILYQHKGIWFRTTNPEIPDKPFSQLWTVDFFNIDKSNDWITELATESKIKNMYFIYPDERIEWIATYNKFKYNLTKQIEFIRPKI